MFQIIQQGATTYYDEIVFEAPLSIPDSLSGALILHTVILM